MSIQGKSLKWAIPLATLVISITRLFAPPTLAGWHKLQLTFIIITGQNVPLLVLMPPASRQQIGLRMIQTTRLRPASKGNTGGRIDTPRFMDVRTAGKGPAAIGTQTKGRNLLERMEGANSRGAKATATRSH